MSQERERSRAYPVIDLEAAYELLSEDLRSLGSESLDREALAKRLGYETGGGGVAARKIGALVQYGFLDRHSGNYGLSLKGRNLQKVRRGTQKFVDAIESALNHPPLFSWIFDRFQRDGEIPENLSMILAREYGITARASYEAANVFLRSARFAGVLDVDGCFVDRSEPIEAEGGIASQPGPFQPEAGIKPIAIRLTNDKEAHLSLPDVVTEDDVELLEEWLQFMIEKRRLRKILSIDPKTGKVISGDFGQQTRKPKG